VAASRPHTPLRIGLTGGIASGKSLVADSFHDLGVPVIDTDIIAREVVRPGQPALDEIRTRFGEGVLDDDGELDRAAMRELIFSDQGARHDLEAILHPRIGAETRRQADSAGGDYQIIVVPLLVGSPLTQFVDRILVVDCEEETQIQRLLARDTEMLGQAERIVAAQASREERLSIADDVINNEFDLDYVRKQVAALDSQYRSLANA
jgi:dephospho-CoA kinase